MAAAHLDNFLFLLFIAVAILFQLLTRAASKGGRRNGGDTNRRSTKSPTPRSVREETEEDRVRKFLEALGQPTTSKPPPPARPRLDIPPRPVAPIKPPREMAPEIWPRKIRLPGQIPPTREAKVFRPRVMETPTFEVHDVGVPLTTPAVVKTAAEAYAIATRSAPKIVEKKDDIITRLRSVSGLRDAIILREIFGPPRSLQPLDLVGNV